MNYILCAPTVTRIATIIFIYVRFFWNIDNIHEIQQIPKLFILILQSVEYIEWCLDSFYVELDSDRDPSVAIKIEDELDFSLLTRSSSKYRWRFFVQEKWDLESYLYLRRLPTEYYYTYIN